MLGNTYGLYKRFMQKWNKLLRSNASDKLLSRIIDFLADVVLGKETDARSVNSLTTSIISKT